MLEQEQKKKERKIKNGVKNVCECLVWDLLSVCVLRACLRGPIFFLSSEESLRAPLCSKKF